MLLLYLVVLPGSRAPEELSSLSWTSRTLARGASTLAALLLATAPPAYALVARGRAKAGAALVPGAGVLLLVWTALTLLVPIVYVQASAKYVLPILPALAIAAVRSAPSVPRSVLTAMLLGFTSIGALAAVADDRLAQAHRRLAEDVVHPLAASGRPVWFSGRWGFHWYAEAAGARPIDRGAPPASGALVVEAAVAKTAWKSPASWPVRATHAAPDTFPVRIMSLDARAGFYSHAWGLLPFGIGTAPLERLTVREVP
jgi:hypothetical protein